MQHSNTTIIRFSSALLLGAAMIGGVVYADEGAAPAAAPTKHQLMKECMVKQKAADSGRPNYELSADCKDIVKAEKQNADAALAVDAKQLDAKTPR